MFGMVKAAPGSTVPTFCMTPYRLSCQQQQGFMHGSCCTWAGGAQPERVSLLQYGAGVICHASGGHGTAACTCSWSARLHHPLNLQHNAVTTQPRLAQCLQAVARVAGVETRHALYSELGVLGSNTPSLYLQHGVRTSLSIFPTMIFCRRSRGRRAWRRATRCIRSWACWASMCSSTRGPSCACGAPARR